MKVKFAPSFFESLETLNRHSTWWYRSYDTLTKRIPSFLKNVWTFRKGLWAHRWYDWRGTFELMIAGLDHMSDNIKERGIEVDESRLKKVVAMKRASEIMRNAIEENYMELAEKELKVKLEETEYADFNFAEDIDHPGFLKMVDNRSEKEKEKYQKVLNRSYEIQEREWKELWQIFKGQDYSKFDREKSWESQFDGSGVRGWWD